MPRLVCLRVSPILPPHPDCHQPCQMKNSVLSPHSPKTQRQERSTTKNPSPSPHSCPTPISCKEKATACLLLRPRSIPGPDGWLGRSRGLPRDWSPDLALSPCRSCRGQGCLPSGRGAGLHAAGLQDSKGYADQRAGVPGGPAGQVRPPVPILSAPLPLTWRGPQGGAETLPCPARTCTSESPCSGL